MISNTCCLPSKQTGGLLKQSPTFFLMTLLFTGLMWSAPLWSQKASLAFGEPLFQVAQATEDNESEASKGAKEKLTGAADMASDTWNRVTEWVMGYVNALKAKVDGVFGFKGGEGSNAFFGSVLYFGIGLVLLFALMFVYNIIRDMFAGVAAKKKHKRRY